MNDRWWIFFITSFSISHLHLKNTANLGISEFIEFTLFLRRGLHVSGAHLARDRRNRPAEFRPSARWRESSRPLPPARPARCPCRPQGGRWVQKSLKQKMKVTSPKLSVWIDRGVTHGQNWITSWQQKPTCSFFLYFGSIIARGHWCLKVGTEGEKYPQCNSVAAHKPHA